MSRNLVFGGALSALVVLAALMSFVWTPFEHTAMNIPSKLQAPNGDALAGDRSFRARHLFDDHGGRAHINCSGRRGGWHWL